MSLSQNPLSPFPLLQQPQPPPPPPTWLDHARDTLLGVGNIMDLPGSSVRDVMAGRNPFDQYLDPLGRRGNVNRTSGQGLLQHHGLLDQGNSFWHHAAGIGTEVLTDPLSAMFLAGRVMPHLARALPKTAATALRSPLIRKVTPAARLLPKRLSTQLKFLATHNLLARADPIIYAADRDAQLGG